jgi:hypothetical protein
MFRWGLRLTGQGTLLAERADAEPEKYPGLRVSAAPDRVRPNHSRQDEELSVPLCQHVRFGSKADKLYVTAGRLLRPS